MSFVLTMALSCSVFMGMSIESNATSVSGNEVTNEATVSENEASAASTVSENEIPDSGTVLGDETPEASEETKFIGVSDVKWSEPGVLSFVFYDTTPAVYTIEVEKDGCSVNSIQMSNLLEWNQPGDTITYPVYADIEESGTYKFRVKVSESEEGSWDFTTGCVSEYSPEFVYTLPSAKLSTPANVRWSMNQAGLAEWDRVENAHGYQAFLYNKDGGLEIGYTSFYNSSNPDEDFIDQIGEKGPYTLKVRAIAKDIVNITHSDWVSVEYDSLDNIVEEVNNSLDATLADIEIATTAEEVAAIVTELKNDVVDSKSDLQVSMQASADTKAKIESLESSYKEKANITQTAHVDETIMNPSQVKILGASLNAEPNATVDFKVSLPTEEDKALINKDLYKSVLAFEMGLEGAGINSSDLAIPVCITLPIPAGMDAGNLRILHYSTAGADPVIYDSSNIRLNGDGTFSFSITHFSLFAIVEMEESQGSSNGGSQCVVTSNGGSQQNVSVANWVPTTPDEKKRYAVMGKEAVECVPAATNKYAVSVRNAMQGPKCFVSFEAVLGDYTIGRTYNILPENKTAYSMSSAAKITLSIPKALRKDGRDFRMICVTENGMPYVLKDLDNDPNTITFETDKYYAFALIYK